jgi:hydroxyethylthiazole kinase-like uncharacterized protein yjeF
MLMESAALSVEQIRDIDRLATDAYGIPSIVLMEIAGENAALGALKLLKDFNWGKQPEDPVVSVVCGSGNNAGDGFVAAKLLYNRGLKVTVYLLKDAKAYKGDALVNLEIIRKMNIRVKDASANGVKEEIADSSVIIDSIFGTGLKGETGGIQKSMIEFINGLGKPVLAVDIPSGLDGDTGMPLGSCVRASLTVSMGFMKKGFLNPVSRKYTGEIIVADIGYPRDIMSKLESS